MKVRDEVEDLTSALEQGFQEADIIITTGGLGPTEDDLTKKIVADWLGLTIKESAEAKKTVVQQFEEKSREYNEEKFDYHLIPEGFEALHNRIGYAPGLFYKKEKKILICLPGVPSEFQGMIEDHLLEKLPNKSLKVQENLIYKTWGIPESHIFHKLEPKLWEKLKSFGSVSSLPHLSGVDIGVTVTADSEEELRKTEEKVDQIMKSTQLAPHIWFKGVSVIEQAVHDELIKQKLTLATAESCTGGLIADRLTNLSGSSNYLIGSAVTYATESKVRVLGVKSETIEKYNVVSEEVAGEMAARVCELYKSDLAISTTGVAGPTGGTESIPVGTVCIGIALREKIITNTFHLKGDRRTLKIRFADFALHCLYKEIHHGSF